MGKRGAIPKEKKRLFYDAERKAWEKLRKAYDTGDTKYKSRINWTKRAEKYAKETQLKKNVHKFNKWTKLAGLRFLEDLKRAKKRRGRPFEYLPGEVNKVCEFISRLPHVEGRWKTDHIQLEPFQVFILANLFGFRNKDGTRRFKTALFAVARKNAKSTLAAAISLYCQIMEDEEGPQVISAATTGDQAKIVFNIARKMAERKGQLQDVFNLHVLTRNIYSLDNGGEYKPIHAKASTQDGLNPSMCVLDELHAHKNNDLLDVLRSASGARRNTLYLYTTTEGYETPGPWPEVRQFTQHVLQGMVDADHFFGIIYSIDDDDDEFCERTWIKANPLMDGNPTLLSALRDHALEAKNMPGRRSEFLIKRVNRQAQHATGWIDLGKWKLCQEDFDIEELRDYPCWGGMDLANTRDLTSFRLVWEKDGIIYTKGWRWVPQTTVEERIRKNLVPYRAWVNAGHMIETVGDVIDYDVIFEKVLEVHQQFRLVAVGYDPWNSSQIAKKLIDNDVNMEKFIQGPRSYHPAMKYFEEHYWSGRFRHNGDPVLTWCAANICSRYDQNNNMAPDKRKSADKIDDVTALLMATGQMIKQEEEEDLDLAISDPIILR